MSRRKTKKTKGRVNNDSFSDNDSYNDMASVHSNGSCEAENGPLDDVLISTSEKYEEKILQLIESCTEKSAKIRILALKSMCEILQHRYFPDFIADRKLTIIDIIEKSSRRGKDEEQELAARLAILLIIQIGGEPNAVKTICQILSTSKHNSGASCNALAMFYFLTGNDINEITSAMSQFDQIFSASNIKGERKLSLASDELVQLHVEAIEGWSLLATLIPGAEFCSYISNGAILRSINNLIGLLNSPHVEIRMACGEIIAVILERGRISDDNFLEEYIPNLIELTSVLSKDSQKHRGKKERKAQRASFRDVVRYLEEGISPDIQIRFGKESLIINTWSTSIQYKYIQLYIGPGITTHLTENEFIRDIFELGSKMVHKNNASTSKQSKLERHLMNAAAFKARTVSMKKSRDKRAVVFN